MKNLTGKGALLTGASRGIGPFIAKALAAQRMRLALVARSASGLEGVAAEVRAAGADAIVLPGDLLTPGTPARIVQQAIEALGGIDVLVNNAGVETPGVLESLDWTEIEATVRLDLLVPMELSRAVLPGMLQRRTGHIVQVSSMAALVPPARYESYCASKAGLVGFSRSLRASLRGSGVGASSVLPSFVREAGMRADAERDTGVGIPALAGSVSPDAVARAVVRAIRHDRPEIVVAPFATHLLNFFLAPWPRATAAISRWIGVDRFGHATAASRTRGGAGHPEQS